MSERTESLIQCHIHSLIGGRSENQDSAGIVDSAVGTVVVVCDGMGALNGGSVASSLAVKTIIEEVSSAQKGDSPSEVLRNAIICANNAILDMAENDPELTGMGTTVTAAIINDQCATVTYLGDSRIYQLRGTKKVFRTFDHSVVFQSVAMGIITEEQARLSSQSNIITKALGIRREIELEIFELPYLAGDRFVLCTDGFWGAMPEKDFIRLIAKGNVCATLEKAAAYIDHMGASHGGHHDNLTAAVFDVKRESKKKVKMSKRVKILVAVLTLLLLASAGMNVYQWKTGDKVSEPSGIQNTDEPKKEAVLDADQNGQQQKSDKKEEPVKERLQNNDQPETDGEVVDEHDPGADASKVGGVKDKE